MKIIKDSIEEVLRRTNYIYELKYSDDRLNSLYNYYLFLNEYEEELKVIKSISLENILYSKYFWFSRFSDRFYEIYGFDAGIEQQQFNIIDEIDRRLDNVDWNFVEMIQYGKMI